MSRRHHSKKRAIVGIGAAMIAFAALAYGFKTTSVDVPASAPGTGSGTVSLERYSPPHVVSKAAARYPRNALRKRREGWVQLHFMVDTSGRPYEIAVTDSVGDRVFQEAAVEALEESTFDPARLDGNPIDAGHSIHYNFERRRDARPRRWFARTHKLAMRAIEAEDREQADRLLGQLSSVSDRNWSIRTLGVLNPTTSATWNSSAIRERRSPSPSCRREVLAVRGRSRPRDSRCRADRRCVSPPAKDRRRGPGAGLPSRRDASVPRRDGGSPCRQPRPPLSSPPP